MLNKNFKSPFSLSVAKEVSLKWSAKDALKGYFRTWYKVTPERPCNGGLSFKLGPENSSIMITIPETEAEIKTKIDLPKADMSLGTNWELEGHVSLDITVTKLDKHKKAEPAPVVKTSVSPAEIVFVSLGFALITAETISYSNF